MKPEIKEKWLAALRSGDYKQGRGALKRILNGEVVYCCLGVLSDLYAKETGVAWVGEGGSSSTSFCLKIPHTNYKNYGIPAKAVQEWSGLFEAEGYGGTKGVIALNDMGFADFHAIADEIEKTL